MNTLVTEGVFVSTAITCVVSINGQIQSVLTKTKGAPEMEGKILYEMFLSEIPAEDIEVVGRFEQMDPEAQRIWDSLAAKLQEIPH